MGSLEVVLANVRRYDPWSNVTRASYTVVVSVVVVSLPATVLLNISAEVISYIINIVTVRSESISYFCACTRYLSAIVVGRELPQGTYIVAVSVVVVVISASWRTTK
jgi:hypothetical protein